MSVPWVYQEDEEKDAAHQQKRLLLLLTGHEPEARQLLQQHLFKAEVAKLDGEELSCSHFPGSAFDKVSVSGWFDIDLDDMMIEEQTEHSTASDSSSADSSSSSLKDP
jgi:hypothetical protein